MEFKTPMEAEAYHRGHIDGQNKFFEVLVRLHETQAEPFVVKLKNFGEHHRLRAIAELVQLPDGSDGPLVEALENARIAIDGVVANDIRRLYEATEKYVQFKKALAKARALMAGEEVE